MQTVLEATKVNAVEISTLEQRCKNFLAGIWHAKSTKEFQYEW